MKILLINYEFPPVGGGAGNATQNLAREFINLGNEVMVVTSSFSGLPSDEIIDGYRVVRIPTKREYLSQCSPSELPLFCWSAFIHLPKIIKKWRPDKTIAFFSIPSGIIAYYLKLIYKIPYIVSLRGADVPGFWKDRMKFLHWLTLPINKLIWKKAERVVANSHGLKEIAEQTAKKIGVKIDVIPNGVDTNIFKPAFGIAKSHKKFKILFVGRLTTQKRVDILIRALNIFIDKNLNFRDKIVCEIVGDGPTDQELRDLVKEFDLEDIIDFSGWMDRKDLSAKYQSADVLVLSSDDEGMPNVILEAMASGLPVIATRIAGNEELIKNNQNGYLISREESVVLAEYLYNLIINRDLLEDFGRQSLELVKSYSWRDISRRYLNN